MADLKSLAHLGVRVRVPPSAPPWRHRAETGIASSMSRTVGPVSLKVAPAPAVDVFHDMVRVHLTHRPFANAGRIIIVRHGRNRILAVARGAPKNCRDTIWLDLRAREQLDVAPSTVSEFYFEEAGLLAEIRWAWSATDAMPRVAARLGAISVALGFIGLLLGGLSVWLSLR